MKNIIDKDISLFLPKKYKFLLLGGNFLLSKRLYEITKRQFEIKRIDYDFKNTEEYFPCIDSLGFDIFLEPAKKIQTIIDLHNSNVLVFRPMDFLGRISYSYYLLHYPVYFLMNQYFPTPNLLIKLVSIFIATFLAYLSWWKIESHFWRPSLRDAGGDG